MDACPSARDIPRRSVASRVLYDLANTSFSLGVVTLYFAGLVKYAFGLYSMVGRFGAIVGPAMWVIIVEALGWGQPVAVLFLLLWVVIAFIVLRLVDDRPRNWGSDDLPGWVDGGA